MSDDSGQVDISQWIEDLEEIRDNTELDNKTKALISTVVYWLHVTCESLVSSGHFTLVTSSQGHAITSSEAD